MCDRRHREKRRDGEAGEAISSRGERAGFLDPLDYLSHTLSGSLEFLDFAGILHALGLEVLGRRHRFIDPGLVLTRLQVELDTDQWGLGLDVLDLALEILGAEVKELIHLVLVGLFALFKGCVAGDDAFMVRSGKSIGKLGFGRDGSPAIDVRGRGGHTSKGGIHDCLDVNVLRQNWTVIGEWIFHGEMPESAVRMTSAVLARLVELGWKRQVCFATSATNLATRGRSFRCEMDKFHGPNKIEERGWVNGWMKKEETLRRPPYGGWITSTLTVVSQARLVQSPNLPAGLRLCCFHSSQLHFQQSYLRSLVHHGVHVRGSVPQAAW